MSRCNVINLLTIGLRLHETSHLLGKYKGYNTLKITNSSSKWMAVSKGNYSMGNALEKF